MDQRVGAPGHDGGLDGVEAVAKAGAVEVRKVVLFGLEEGSEGRAVASEKSEVERGGGGLVAVAVDGDTDGDWQREDLDVVLGLRGRRGRQGQWLGLVAAAVEGARIGAGAAVAEAALAAVLTEGARGAAAGSGGCRGRGLGQAVEDGGVRLEDVLALGLGPRLGPGGRIRGQAHAESYEKDAKKILQKKKKYFPSNKKVAKCISSGKGGGFGRAKGSIPRTEVSHSDPSFRFISIQCKT